MEPQRVHILGASGSGTTTLGRALADAWAVPHADVDDYFWEPTEPPYTTKRDPFERIALMKQVFLPRSAWVLSGSLSGWGDELIELFDGVVFITVEPSVRISRLQAREMRRYGSRIDAGGDLAADHGDFLAWAAGYDEPDFAGRSHARHERWLATMRCPILRIDANQPVTDLLRAVLDWVPPHDP